MSGTRNSCVPSYRPNQEDESHAACREHATVAQPRDGSADPFAKEIAARRRSSTRAASVGATTRKFVWLDVSGSAMHTVFGCTSASVTFRCHSLVGTSWFIIFE